MDSPESLVDLIFIKCSLVYGRDFMSRWEGLDISEVKADWERELGRLSAHSVRYGLENLPRDKPPNVLQFREICRHAPERRLDLVALQAPETPEDAEARERIREILAQTRARLTGTA